MNDVDYILDFAVRLGARMLNSGANLERVDDTITRVCLSYKLEEVSLFSLSSIIQLSARTADGTYGYRQLSIMSTGIHLERLNNLNRLSRRVCAETPEPSELISLLKEAEETVDYNIWQVIGGQMLAMACVCMLSGGTLFDTAAAVLLVFCLFWLKLILDTRNLNRIVVNTLCMLFAGTAAQFLVWLGLGSQYFIIIITCGLMMVPGIPLVNSVRNLLCGNEMNGILEFFKAVLETLAIVAGLILSIYLFGNLFGAV